MAHEDGRAAAAEIIDMSANGDVPRNASSASIGAHI